MSVVVDHYPPPPRADGNDAEYAAVREAFRAAGYTTENLVRHYKLATLSRIFEGGLPEPSQQAITDPMVFAAEAFLVGRLFPKAEFEQHLGAPCVEAAVRLGLLCPVPTDDPEDAAADLHFGAAVLYPVEELLVASDRVVTPPGYTRAPPADAVYSALTTSGETFLSLLPRPQGGRFLEVCAGCGPAALLAAPGADSVVAADLTPRSVAFAAFNARLNGFTRFEARATSLYEGLEPGFDMIAAHPPYMPTIDDSPIYYAGGDDGSGLLAECIRQAPAQLNPGGIFYAVALVPSSASVPVIDRIRQWLGPAQEGCDVFFFPIFNNSLREMAMSAAMKNGGGIHQVMSMQKRLQGFGHERYEFGAIVVRRCTGEAPVSVRRQISDATSWRHLKWCVDWELACRVPERMEAFLDAPITTRSETEVNVSQRMTAEGLEPVSFRAVVREPLSMESQLEGWMMHVFHRARAGATPRQIFEGLIADHVLHPETPLPEFVRLLSIFVAGSYLETAICPLPGAAE